MSNALPNVWKKEDMNPELRSEVTCDGIPCLEKTWITKSWVSCAEVMVSSVGIKIDCFVRWLSELVFKGLMAYVSKRRCLNTANPEILV
jgi:hypothetical protein